MSHLSTRATTLVAYLCPFRPSIMERVAQYLHEAGIKPDAFAEYLQCKEIREVEYRELDIQKLALDFIVTSATSTPDSSGLLDDFKASLEVFRFQMVDVDTRWFFDLTEEKAGEYLTGIPFAERKAPWEFLVDMTGAESYIIPDNDVTDPDGDFDIQAGAYTLNGRIMPMGMGFEYEISLMKDGTILDQFESGDGIDALDFDVAVKAVQEVQAGVASGNLNQWFDGMRMTGDLA